MGTGRGVSEVERESADPSDPRIVAEDAGRDAAPASVPPIAPPRAAATFVTCGHDVLFDPDRGETSNRCDVCDKVVEEDSGEGAALPGRALYVWARGEVIRREEPPLCPACAAALGLSALGRWEIEEEEG